MWSHSEILEPDRGTNHPVPVPISSLLPADSPRLNGESPEHVELLVAARDLPPILVHRGSMRVVDGMHRLRAAELRGDTTVPVTFFDGDAEDAFLLSVDVNVRHGLPLSRADREAAASRILAVRRHWSDRAVAAAAGLSPTTVSAIRRRRFPSAGREGFRVGRDGRVRPLDASAGRRRAGEVIARMPEASLRVIAREAGISLGTARDVRERVRAGQEPVLETRPGTARGETTERAVAPERYAGDVSREGVDWNTVRDHLSRDPAVRYAENGRAFVRWVDGHLVDPVEWGELIDAVPPHWRDSVAALARSCAGAWLRFARELERGGPR